MLPGKFNGHLKRSPAYRTNPLKVAGGRYRELERPLVDVSSAWIGEEMFSVSVKAGAFFRKLGGYPLPGQRALTIEKNVINSVQ